ncbi:unnamed protein product, partial [Amoebophrya sp. A25]|eukprot:GSA25T00004228001.1
MPMPDENFATARQVPAVPDEYDESAALRYLQDELSGDGVKHQEVQGHPNTSAGACVAATLREERNLTSTAARVSSASATSLGRPGDARTDVFPPDAVEQSSFGIRRHQLNKDSSSSFSAEELPLRPPKYEPQWYLQASSPGQAMTQEPGQHFADASDQTSICAPMQQQVPLQPNGTILPSAEDVREIKTFEQRAHELAAS